METIDRKNCNLRIMVVEHDDLAAKGIEALLKEAADRFMTFLARSAEDALQFFAHFSPHVVLTEYALPGMKGDELIRNIKKLDPKVKAIAVSNDAKPEVIEDMIRTGADGFLCKATLVQEMFTALEITMDGGFYFKGGSAEVAANYGLKKLKRLRTMKGGFTEVEKHVMKLMYSENTTEEIAAIKGMSVSGVETVRKRIFDKTKSQSVVGVIKFIFKNGLDDEFEKWKVPRRDGYATE